MLNVCLTFDYELFLGKNNASYKNILFDPTDNIMMALSNLETKGTFFVDVCSVAAHHRLGDEDYCNDFTHQIEKLTKMGHDVQLHLHTNWMYAQKTGDNIIPGKDGYRIHSFGLGENGEARQIIKDGKQYLEKTCRPHNSGYKCIAFRAGGFSVQPEGDLFKALVDNGIVIDSSVVPHMKADTINNYDFRKVPNEMNWWIDPSKGLNNSVEKTEKCIFEVPIATARPRLLQLIGKSKSEMSLPPQKPLGEYVKSSLKQKSQNIIARQFHKLFDYRYVSLDTRHYMRVMEDLAYFYNHFDMMNNDGYICLICHPKLANTDRVNNIVSLVKKIQEHPDKYSLVSFIDIYNKLFN